MEQKILLEKNRSKYSINTDNFLNLDLTTKSRLLPFNDISDTLNLNQVYLDERDNCQKYRMIFTVNTVCSNVLFNYRTEVMRYEGSSACTVLFEENSNQNIERAKNLSPLNVLQAIKDTEYSHPELFDNKIPYVYHCGLDIFNNHMLRNNDFVFINTVNERTDVFNTIRDTVRNNKGIIQQEDVAPGFATPVKKDIHVYQYDTILSMYEAFVYRLKVKDGWYGFYNTTNISIPNLKIDDDKNISVNKVLNDNKACEFIDMYPDRSLYSFIPKVNKFKRRIEKNWDYCITYPFKKETELLNTMCGIDNSISENNGGCSIKIIEAKRIYSNSGNNLVRFKTLFKHNLKIGDYIKLYYGSNLEIFNKRIRIIEVGDYEGNNKNRYFAINYNDLNNKFIIDENNEDIIVDNRGNKVQFYYKKDINGVVCQYYFRRFAKITKDNDGITNLTSDVNKLAYGENIYGDRIAQVVFTDDIDVEGLVDHRGRPLTEVYFTVMKRNAGYKEWYENNIFTADTIEYSHCFGKVTSGIDLPNEEYHYNVRKLHNIDFNNRRITNRQDIFSKIFLTSGIPQTIEDDIKYETSYIKENGGTIGDLVEYNPIDDSEFVLEIVQHRFNTAQRETLNPKYSAITYDDMKADDYDFTTASTSSYDGRLNNFTVQETKINISKRLENNEVLTKESPGNLNPEGYFYNPYTKIKIRELSDNINKVIGRTIIINSSNKLDTNMLNLTTSIDYGLMKNDVLCIYNNEIKKTFWGYIEKVEGNSVDLYLEDADVFNINTCSIISTLEGVPSYATYLPSSHSFVWRNIVPMSELENNSELLNMPFSNGRNYIEKNVNLFVRRQDPIGEYGLFTYDKDANYKSTLNIYKIKGWYPIDFSGDLFNNGSLGEICY